jgi:F420-dependent oxidoreductase-like protein
MQLGIDVSQHQLTWDELVSRVRLGEQAGFDGAWVFDHFKPLYGDPGGPCLEAWTLLSGLAASTESIRLGALVTGVTYRHPSVLAASAVTVDQVSGGRLELGLGAAWFDREHRELGIPFPPPGERGRRLEEAIQVMRLLMTGDDVSFAGRYYSLDGASYNPEPVQKPAPPLWIGASGPRGTWPIAARHADVWHTFGDPGALRRKAEIGDRHAEAAGRDPSEIRRATTLSISEPWDEVRRRVDETRDLGFSYLTVSWPSEGRARLEEFVEKVMREIE